MGTDRLRRVLHDVSCQHGTDASIQSVEPIFGGTAPPRGVEPGLQILRREFVALVAARQDLNDHVEEYEQTRCARWTGGHRVQHVEHRRKGSLDGNSSNPLATTSGSFPAWIGIGVRRCAADIVVLIITGVVMLVW